MIQSGVQRVKRESADARCGPEREFASTMRQSDYTLALFSEPSYLHNISSRRGNGQKTSSAAGCHVQPDWRALGHANDLRGRGPRDRRPAGGGPSVRGRSGEYRGRTAAAAVSRASLPGRRGHFRGDQAGEVQAHASRRDPPQRRSRIDARSRVDDRLEISGSIVERTPSRSPDGRDAVSQGSRDVPLRISRAASGRPPSLQRGDDQCFDG